MNPEDPMQFDSLASKLSLLQPASTDRLQALAFLKQADAQLAVGLHHRD
ncbi:MAG: hypothetical protein R3C56_01810 [Pirellulaceae bacterium]